MVVMQHYTVCYNLNIQLVEKACSLFCNVPLLMSEASLIERFISLAFSLFLSATVSLLLQRLRARC